MKNNSISKLKFPPIPSKWRSRKYGTRHVIDRAGGQIIIYIQGKLIGEYWRDYNQSRISLKAWHEYQKTAAQIK